MHTAGTTAGMRSYTRADTSADTIKATIYVGYHVYIRGPSRRFTLDLDSLNPTAMCADREIAQSRMARTPKHVQRRVYGAQCRVYCGHLLYCWQQFGMRKVERTFSVRWLLIVKQ